MPSVLELFNQREVLTYLQNRQYPAMLGETLFPEIKRDSLEFDQIKGARKIPVVASVHAFDTEAEIGSREASKKALELALIKRKLPLLEKDIIALENPRTPAEQQYLMQDVFNDIDTLVAGVKARIEVMRMEATANGEVELALADDKGTVKIDYGVPTNHKEVLSGTDLWSDPNSDPIEQMIDWYNTLGTKPPRALTSTKALSALLRNPKVVGALFGKDSSRIASRKELNAYLEQLELPTIATYDQMYRKQNPDGTYSQYRYFPENKFILLPEGALGQTIYGPTPEEIRLTRDPNIDTQMVGNILAMVYEGSVDPVSTWTKAVATALPSFPAADEVFQAQVL